MVIDWEFIKRVHHSRGGIPYKYVVYSPRTNSVGHQFEFLHGVYPYESPENNRLLKIPNDKIKMDGI